MITSWDEYIDLLDNQEHPVSQRAVTEEVSEKILFRAIQERPDLKPAVIANKLISFAVLLSLVDDPDPRIRSRVAKKRKLPLDYLHKLAHDPDDDVRREVVHHTKIWKQTLEHLSSDEKLDIAKRAAKRLTEQDYKPL